MFTEFLDKTFWHGEECLGTLRMSADMAGDVQLRNMWVQFIRQTLKEGLKVPTPGDFFDYLKTLGAEPILSQAHTCTREQSWWIGPRSPSRFHAEEERLGLQVLQEQRSRFAGLRVQRYQFSAELLERIFVLGYIMPATQVIDGLPAGANLVAADYDLGGIKGRVINAYFEHDSFELAPEYGEVPTSDIFLKHISEQPHG